MYSAQLPAPLHMRPEVTKPQTHLYIQRYMTESDWKILRDDGMTFQSKMTCLVDRAAKLGVLSLQEKTKVNICVVPFARSMLHPL